MNACVFRYIHTLEQRFTFHCAPSYFLPLMPTTNTTTEGLAVGSLEFGMIVHLELYSFQIELLTNDGRSSDLNTSCVSHLLITEPKHTQRQHVLEGSGEDVCVRVYGGGRMGESFDRLCVACQ